MNRNNPVAESHGDLILGKNVVIDPVSAIIQELHYFGANVILVYTKVLIRCSELSCPLPNIPEHPSVQISHKTLGEDMLEAELSPHRPFDCPLDTELFKFIELSTGGNCGNQKTLLLIFIQRCLTIRGVEV